MAESISFGGAHLDVEPGRARQQPRPRDETPFRIVVLGDFSGRSNRAASGGQRGPGPRPVLVDRDNLDEVLAKLGPRLSLPVEGEPDAAVQLRFQELDDFDPDRIYEHASLFQALRETRRRLADAREFEAAAAELGLIRRGGERPGPASRDAGKDRGVSKPGDAPAADPDASLLSGASLLEGALEATAERSRPASEPGARARGREDELSAFLRRVVAPDAVAGPHPKQAEVLARWDEAITEQMRAVLHHPDCQALEAVWRGLFLLTRRLETGTDLKVYLVDWSQQELAADLDQCKDLRECRLAKALADPAADWAGDPGWGVFAGLYRFGHSVEDAVTLARMAVVAGYLGAPFIAEAAPDVFGCESPAATPDPADWKQPRDPEAAQSWEALRAMPKARYLALAAPRFLLRLPYGEETVPAEEFPFEEVSLEEAAGPRHEDFLWGSPAVACACMLGQNFSRHGWEMRPGQVRQMDGIPLFLYKHRGETRQLPTAEAWLGERAAAAMLEDGVLPLLSVKNRDAIVLFDVRSLAEGDEPLAGAWDS
jgi:type VI secretion system ImpC/EvpB family protein/type VI secretion system ImpB/VipA family protein